MVGDGAKTLDDIGKGVVAPVNVAAVIEDKVLSAPSGPPLGISEGGIATFVDGFDTLISGIDTYNSYLELAKKRDLKSFGTATVSTSKTVASTASTATDILHVSQHAATVNDVSSHVVDAIGTAATSVHFVSAITIPYNTYEMVVNFLDTIRTGAKAHQVANQFGSWKSTEKSALQLRDAHDKLAEAGNSYTVLSDKAEESRKFNDSYYQEALKWPDQAPNLPIPDLKAIFLKNTATQRDQAALDAQAYKSAARAHFNQADSLSNQADLVLGAGIGMARKHQASMVKAQSGLFRQKFDPATATGADILTYVMEKLSRKARRKAVKSLAKGLSVAAAVLSVVGGALTIAHGVGAPLLIIGGILGGISALLSLGLAIDKLAGYAIKKSQGSYREGMAERLLALLDSGKTDVPLPDKEAAAKALGALIPSWKAGAKLPEKADVVEALKSW